MSPSDRRLGGNAASLAVLTLLLLVLACFLAAVVALAGLGRLNPSTSALEATSWLWTHRSEPAVRRWLQIALAAGGAAFLVFLVLLFRPRRALLHGAARFASESDLRREGFRARHGLILGRKGGRLLVFGGSEHVVLYAPTRSGKGVGAVIPNLLNWPDSVVALDIKRENWTASAGFRAAHGQQVICFDPLSADGRTHRYNPLGHIEREEPVAVLDELQRIAVMLFPAPERGDPFWAEAARTGFIGLGALIAASPETRFSFGEIHRLLTENDLKPRLVATLEARQRSKSPLSAGAVSALTDFCSTSENTFAGVKQTISSRLNLWLNPHVVAATAVSDFDLREIRDRRMSIYLCASPENLERIGPLYRLFFQQLIDLNTRALPHGDQHQTPVLVLLDEFARLGQASVLAHAFSYVAGYGLRLLPVLQSPAQLRSAFGPDLADDIMANCGAELVFAPKELKVAQELSERLGSYTYEGRTRSRPAGISDGRRSLTLSDQRRPLMLPQELLQMPRDHLLVFRAGMAPIRGRKIRYFEEPAFARRVRPPPELPPRSVDLPPGPTPGALVDLAGPTAARPSQGSDPLTIDGAAPLLAAAGLERLRPGASEKEALAWKTRVTNRPSRPRRRPKKTGPER